jgi:hypothetical protein
MGDRRTEARVVVKYHGTPITPARIWQELAGYDFCISYADPRNIGRARQYGSSLMLDNGAFSAWRRGYVPDWHGYYGWVEKWLGPADWAVIPDVIEGDDEANDVLVKQWPHGQWGSPVWHLHEPLDRLRQLTDRWHLVCLGSSGEFAQVGTERWERRINQAFGAVCSGRFVPRLHGLRMLSMAGKGFPFASVDSTDIARNHATETWKTPAERARGWAVRQCPHRFTPALEQMEMFV